MTSGFCLAMTLTGFTRICVNIHHPARAASFKDLAGLKKNETDKGTGAFLLTPVPLSASNPRRGTVRLAGCYSYHS